MILHGARPTYPQRTDYDHLKSFGASAPPSFPDEYFTDAGITMPNQNTEGLEYGCTDETQADLATDDTLTFHNPFDLEVVTHANALGGYDIRKSLDAAMKMGWFSAYFNVRPHQLDFFGTGQLAMMSGGLEKRSLSVGSKWFPDYESITADGILPVPRNWNNPNATWHNWKICGWKLINGEPHLIGKSWQGPHYGDKGFHYINRAHFNALMAVPGSAVFSATSVKPDTIFTVNMTFVQWLMQYIRTFTNFSY